MNNCVLQARLAQSVEHETLNLRVVGSSPTLGANVLQHCAVTAKHLRCTLNSEDHATLIANVCHFPLRAVLPTQPEPFLFCLFVVAPIKYIFKPLTLPFIPHLYH